MTEATEKTGLLNRDKVHTFLFGLINLPLFAAVLITIFAIWDCIIQQSPTNQSPHWAH